MKKKIINTQAGMKFIDMSGSTENVIGSILNDTNNFHILIYTFNRPSISFFIQLLKLEEIVISTKQIEAYALWDLVTITNDGLEAITNLASAKKLFLSESKKIKVVNLATEGSNSIHTRLKLPIKGENIFFVHP